MTTFTTARDRTTKTDRIISGLQIECDKLAWDYVELKKENTLQRKLLLLSEVVDFNTIVISCLIPLFIDEKGIDLLIHNQSEISRKLTLLDFLTYCELYRHVKICAPKKRINIS